MVRVVDNFRDLFLHEWISTSSFLGRAFGRSPFWKQMATNSTWGVLQQSSAFKIQKMSDIRFRLFGTKARSCPSNIFHHRHYSTTPGYSWRGCPPKRHGWQSEHPAGATVRYQIFIDPCAFVCRCLFLIYGCFFQRLMLGAHGLSLEDQDAEAIF